MFCRCCSRSFEVVECYWCRCDGGNKDVINRNVWRNWLVLVSPWHFVENINNFPSHMSIHVLKSIHTHKIFSIYDNSGEKPSIRNNIFLVYSTIFLFRIDMYSVENFCSDFFFLICNMTPRTHRCLPFNAFFFCIKDMLSLFVTTFASHTVLHTHISRLCCGFSLFYFVKNKFFH